MATLLLVRWCLARGIKRFLYASSMAVYGDGAAPMEEDAPCVPKSHYGVSKLTSEHLLRLAAQQGISCTSFRMFSVYGPGQNLENLKQGMVSIYLAYMLRGVSVPVTGSLERIRDFIYIDDGVLASAAVGAFLLVYTLVALPLGFIADRIARKTVVAAGVAIFLPLEERWYRRERDEIGVRQFAIQDPDGYLLRFSQVIGAR